jgi:hypothetical protein
MGHRLKCCFAADGHTDIGNTPPMKSAIKNKLGAPMAYVFETIPADRGLIDMGNPREVSWWRKRFECSEEQLREAVAKVGTNAARVEQVLDGSQMVVTL